MKRALFLLALGLLGIGVLYFVVNRFGVQAQTGCCNPPHLAPSTPRFPQGATVNVHLVASSGFTQTEMDNIKAGLESWNGQANNTGIVFNVTTNHGNEFRYRAKVKDSSGADVGRWAWDVFLLVEQ